MAIAQSTLTGDTLTEQFGSMTSTQTKSLQYQLQQDDQLCLLHIPKTAGSTLTALMDTNFHVHEIFPGTSIGDCSAEELSQYRLFRGHYDYNVNRFFPKPLVYTTMLREPIERVISLYEFWKRDVERGGGVGDRRERSDDLRRASMEGLEGFVCNEDPWVRLRTCNRQVRQIALGVGGIKTSPSEGIPDDELLDMAKQHLDECAFWGLTERFQESIFLMAYIFGWYPVADVQNLRVAKRKLRKDSVEPAVLQRIQDVNQLDIALYDYAQEKFQELYSQMLHELRSPQIPNSLTAEQAELLETQQATPQQRIEFLLPVLEQHYERRYPEQKIEPLKSYDFNCLQPLNGKGWHRRNGKKNGVIITDTPFRWTGPGTESTMDLPLDSSEDRFIRAYIINAITPEVLNSFRVRVNGHKIALTPLEKRSRFAILQGVIEADWMKGNCPFSRIVFEVDQTMSPHSLDSNNSDTRDMGVALHRVQIFSVSADAERSEFVYYRFPEKDHHWTETADFLVAHLNSQDRLMAMGEFSKKFPKQFCSFLESLPERPDISWVVIHKGHYQDLDRGSLSHLLKQFKPVYANPVFVIFTRRDDVPSLNPWTKDVLNLTARIRLLQLEDRGLLSAKLRQKLVTTAKTLLKPLRS